MVEKLSLLMAVFQRPTEEELELQQASLLFESYTVPNGSDYHTIAEKQYGNRHLWPVIYAENKINKGLAYSLNKCVDLALFNEDEEFFLS